MTKPATIRLGQFMKLVGLAATGGEAKYLIQEGYVHVNGQVETRRRRQLVPGDIVALDEHTRTVAAEDIVDNRSTEGERSP